MTKEQIKKLQDIKKDCYVFSEDTKDRLCELCNEIGSTDFHKASKISVSITRLEQFFNELMELQGNILNDKLYNNDKYNRHKECIYRNA